MNLIPLQRHFHSHFISVSWWFSFWSCCYFCRVFHGEEKSFVRWGGKRGHLNFAQNSGNRAQCMRLVHCCGQMICSTVNRFWASEYFQNYKRTEYIFVYCAEHLRSEYMRALLWQPIRFGSRVVSEKWIECHTFFSHLQGKVAIIFSYNQMWIRTMTCLLLHFRFISSLQNVTLFSALHIVNYCNVTEARNNQQKCEGKWMNRHLSREWIWYFVYFLFCLFHDLMVLWQPQAMMLMMMEWTFSFHILHNMMYSRCKPWFFE